MPKLSYADRSVGKDDATRRRRLIQRRVLRITLITASLLLVAAVIAYPFVRRVALNRVYYSVSGSGGTHFNLKYYWGLVGPEAQLRVVLSPSLLTDQANEYYLFGEQRPPANPAQIGPRGRADEIWYGSQQLNYPPGADTAIVELDGTIRYTTLSPTYIHLYGKKHEVIWLFTLDHPADLEIDLDALDKAGLLPAYAHYIKKFPIPETKPVRKASTRPNLSSK